MMTFEVRGLDHLLDQIKRKGPQAVKAVDAVVQRSATRFEVNARKFAPVDTGHLSNSIYSVKVADMAARVVSPAHYSQYLEVGTRYMAAQPFFRPALDAELPMFTRDLKELFGR